MKAFKNKLVFDDVVFNKALVTEHHVFYTDGDESDQIKAYRRSDRNDPNRLVFEGYGADELFYDAVENKEIVWANEHMKYNIECVLEENNNV